jgi:hypothetical protein
VLCLSFQGFSSSVVKKQNNNNNNNFTLSFIYIYIKNLNEKKSNFFNFIFYCTSAKRVLGSFFVYRSFDQNLQS